MRTSNFTPLKKWFHVNRYFVKKDETPRRLVTHLLMDGGSVAIPDNTMNEFYKKYASDVENGHMNYIVEQRTPYFNFLVDMDFFGAEAVSLKNMEDYTLFIQLVLKDFFTDAPPGAFKAIVCSRPPSKCKDGIKTGVHIVFPDIPVTSEIGLILRNAIVQKLTEGFGGRELEENTWSKVIDSSVYKGNGLRMPGSGKIELCSKCKGVLKQPCGICSGDGKVDIGRIYVPVLVVGGKQGELEELKVDKLKMVLATKVRTLHTISKYDHIIPKWFEPECVIKRTYSEKNNNNNNNNKKKKGHDELGINDKKFKIIAKLINTKFPKNPEITSVRFYTDYFLVRSSSKYCQNKGSEHNSVTTFFHIDRVGVRQKCFCRCDVTRLSGKICKEYASEVIKHTPHIKKSLFPDESISYSYPLGLEILRQNRTMTNPLLNDADFLGKFIRSA